MRSLNTKSLYLIAAAAILLFGGYTIITEQNENTAAELDRLAYPMFTSNADASIKEVYTLCQKEKFEQAIDLINTSTEQESYDPRLQFAKAFCLLKMEDLENAKSLFNELIQDGFPLIQDQSMWYLAVTNIKMEKMKEAEGYLQILAGQPNADFHIEAVNLLQQLSESESTTPRMM